MTDHILRPTERISQFGGRTSKLGVPEQAEGYKVRAHEITPGIVYKDENVTVKAFLVNHGDVRRRSAIG